MTNEEIDRMEAGREMDAQVHIRVMGKRKFDCFNRNAEMRDSWNAAYLQEDTQYSNDIAAAWDVVGALFDDDWLTHAVVRKIGGKQQWAVTAQKTATQRVMAVAERFPLAICRAALKAVNKT